MKEQVQQFRIGIERPGRLHHGLEVVDCEVLDLTEKGLQLRTHAAVRVGEMVQLDVMLDSCQSARCALVVTYLRAPYVGGRIVSMSPEHKARLVSFLERSIIDHVVGF
ncbi:hypothetical protein YTPLAS18_06720 [Nitrospira sp.]|nr:hypothetical protein YTPLAS18_06720 [Nitrospira sp.]